MPIKSLENRSYVDAFIQTFVGIKSHVRKIPKNRCSINMMNVPVWSPLRKSGAELIAYVQKVALEGTYR